MLAKSAERDFDDATMIRQLLQIEVASVFPMANGQLFLPAPNDCVLEKRRNQAAPEETTVVHRVRPEELPAGEGCDWPLPRRLMPALLESTEDFKPAEGPAYWPRDRYTEWLTQPSLSPLGPDYLAGPLADTRDHVCIDPVAGSAEEGFLFTTAGVGAAALPRFGVKVDSPVELEGERRRERFTPVELAARVDNAPDWARAHLESLAVWHPLGGERRLVHWQAPADDGSAWKCPRAVVDALAGTDKVTMTLVTPAVFTGGWKPGWLNHDLTGTPPCGGPPLRLVSVCIQRWRAVSGWSYETGGPKAIRRLVPAGGVYFFQVVAGQAADLQAAWLCSVSDQEHAQDRRDGFGLAVWGKW
jgi:CRISPR-associated protein Cmr3